MDTDKLSESRVDFRLILNRIEQRRLDQAKQLNVSRKGDLGQFFTPLRAADILAQMVHLTPNRPLRVLDPGAGIGALSAALIGHITQQTFRFPIDVVAVELDETLIPALQETLGECRAMAAEVGINLTSSVIHGDLIEMMTGMDRSLHNSFDLVLMNPPYRKLGARSWERIAIKTVGIDSPNLYSAFLSLGMVALKPHGQLIAITPRSFANGPYFQPFRKTFLRSMAINELRIFDSRSTVFSDSGVLQENIVFSALKEHPVSFVRLSVSRDHSDQAFERSVPYPEIIDPDDPHAFLRIPSQQEDTAVAELFASLPCTLRDLGFGVSTGRVVDFRSRGYLLPTPTEGAAPLIYPSNLRNGRVIWPVERSKAASLLITTETEKTLLPNERFVLVKRFSSKEERRRIVAAVYEPRNEAASGIAFENHLNVFHVNNRGLDAELASGLCLWLNSSIVDQFFRTFSGHTQVNATDLRTMRYPKLDQLRALGSASIDQWPGQDVIDNLVKKHVLEVNKHDEAAD